MRTQTDQLSRPTVLPVPPPVLPRGERARAAPDAALRRVFSPFSPSSRGGDERRRPRLPAERRRSGSRAAGRSRENGRNGQKHFVPECVSRPVTPASAGERKPFLGCGSSGWALLSCDAPMNTILITRNKAGRIIGLRRPKGGGGRGIGGYAQMILSAGQYQTE
jgi:hypothetical protein